MTLNNLGISFTNKNYIEVINVTTRMLQADPDNIFALFVRAIGYRRQGEYDRAISDCTQIIDREPLHFKAVLWRGEAHFQKGNYQAAEKDLDKAAVVDIEAQRLLAVVRDKLHYSGGNSSGSLSG